MKYRDLSEINTTTNLDRALISIIKTSAVLSVVVVSIFLMYILGGILFLQISDVDLPYRFLSTHNDPVFNTLATMSGTTIGTACIALVFFTLVSQKNDNDNDAAIVLFFALVGIGFAAGLIRMSIAVTLQFFANLIP
jgi:hypothetical protein